MCQYQQICDFLAEAVLQEDIIKTDISKRAELIKRIIDKNEQIKTELYTAHDKIEELEEEITKLRAQNEKLITEKEELKSELQNATLEKEVK